MNIRENRGTEIVTVNGTSVHKRYVYPAIGVKPEDTSRFCINFKDKRIYTFRINHKEAPEFYNTPNCVYIPLSLSRQFFKDVKDTRSFKVGTTEVMCEGKKVKGAWQILESLDPELYEKYYKLIRSIYLDSKDKFESENTEGLL